MCGCGMRGEEEGVWVCHERGGGGVWAWHERRGEWHELGHSCMCGLLLHVPC